MEALGGEGIGGAEVISQESMDTEQCAIAFPA